MAPTFQRWPQILMAGPNSARGMAPDGRVLLATSIYHLTNDAAVTVMAGQITVLQRELVFGYVDTGLLTAVALLVTVIAQIAFGHNADRRDPARFLAFGIAFLGLASLAITTAASFLPFLGLVALSRIGSAFYHPVGISWIGRAYGGRELDRAMGFQSSFGDVGVILGIASGAILGSSLGWRVPFLLWGALNLVAVVIGLSLSRGRSTVSQHASEPRQRVEYRSVLRDVRYWIFPIAIGGAAFNVVTIFGPVLVKDGFGQSDAVAGVSIALWILAGSIAAFYFGRLSARFGRYRTLLAAYLALTLATLAAATMGFSITLLALWTLGSLLFITYPAVFSYISEASRAGVQGAAFGVIFGFQLVGGAAAAYAAGFLAEAFGKNPAVPFFLASALCAACFVYLVALQSRAKTGAQGPAIAGPQL